MKWYLEVLKKYAVFSGRARRREYWFFVLFNIIVAIGLGMVEGALGIAAHSDQSILAGIYSLAILLPSLAVGVRRLHDIGRTGTWLLLVFVPFIGAVVLLIFFVMDSQPGDNIYGPNPKQEPFRQGVAWIETN